MTNKAAAVILRRALAALTIAIDACENETEPTSQSVNMVIKTTEGTVTLRQDEDIVIQPNVKLVKAVSDSRIERKSADFSMMAQASGQLCPACNGSGRM